MKIAIIGAGSSYTPEIIDGLLGEACFDPLTIALYDLPEAEQRIQIICEFSQRMAKKRCVVPEIVIVKRLEDALEGCDFVVSQFRVGLLQARISDEKIPLKYHLIGQETTGAGGFFKAMRTIPETLRLTQQMEKSCPNAWLINFTNPSGIITEAVNRYSFIKCVGLCNVPYNMHMDAAKLLHAEPERVYCQMVGLNHLSFITQVYLDGTPVLEKMIAQKLFSSQLVKNIPKMPGIENLVQRLGMVPSPYLQYYYYEKEMLEKEIREISDGHGTRGEQILHTQEMLFKIYKDPAVCEKPKELEMRGGAYYSTVATMLIRALCGDKDIVMPVNYCNQGAITDLSAECIVETNCCISKNGVHPLAYGALPKTICGLVQQVKSYETLTVEASVEQSYDKAVQALLAHPLIHGYNNAVSLIEDLREQHGSYIGELK